MMLGMTSNRLAFTAYGFRSLPIAYQIPSDYVKPSNLGIGTKLGDLNNRLQEEYALINSIESRLQQSWDANDETSLIEAKARLATMLRHQHQMLNDKCKLAWVKDGDQNSKLFHAAIKARRIQNAIHLQLPDGSSTVDGDAIGETAADYFKAMFGAFPDTGDLVHENIIEPKISVNNNRSLSAIPEEEEIKRAISDMNASSAPGPDGFTGKFYLSCWDIIKEDLTAAIGGFFKDYFAHLECKIGYCAPFDYQPEQAGFIQGRLIHDSIGLAHDLVRDINTKTFGSNIIIKVDMSKAYDRLSWRFLIKVLLSFGFSHQVRDLIYRNISNCWYTVRWEGKNYQFFKSNRGVRQGDPLSPTLFIIAMDYFSKLINSAVSSNVISPYHVKGTATMVHHLMYADDMLIFTNGRKKYVEALLKLIHNLCDLSGEKAVTWRLMKRCGFGHILTFDEI
ncbi:hypothetical protein QQ045_008897 [Rhodiola kirilowii]